MENLYSAWPDGTNEETKRASRLLKKLKIALVVWLISFIATVIWFSYAP